jgi:hypothetical protein
MAGLELLATGLQTFGTLQQGLSQASAFKYNAALAEEAAQAARESAYFDVERTRKEARTFESAQRAAFAAGGVAATSGSAREILRETATESELEAMMIKLEGEREAGQLESEADLLRRQARQAKISGFLGAGTTLLGGAARSYKTFKKTGKWWKF